MRNSWLIHNLIKLLWKFSMITNTKGSEWWWAHSRRCVGVSCNYYYIQCLDHWEGFDNMRNGILSSPLLSSPLASKPFFHAQESKTWVPAHIFDLDHSTSLSLSDDDLSKFGHLCQSYRFLHFFSVFQITLDDEHKALWDFYCLFKNKNYPEQITTERSFRVPGSVCLVLRRGFGV